MKPIMTKDGSFTFKSDNETYHSISGAFEEAFEKFAKPALKDKLSFRRLRILDLFFGLGYNTAAAMHYYWQNRPDGYLDIVGVENDPGILDEISTLHVPQLVKKEYDILRLLKARDWHHEDKMVRISIIIDDALKAVHGLKDGFDIVFFDPFSPKQSPELWNLEFFKAIARMMKQGGVLTTYSCAGHVRRNLVAAGFEVKDGPRVGRRAPSTIATKP